jgi:probable selenium-dependent hydroxylase accessory protein YqeC
MKALTALGIRRGDVVSIIGMGGKTSLMLALAHEAEGKVLLSTTTKIRPPPGGQVDRLVRRVDALEDGITLLHGGLNEKGKLVRPADREIARGAALAGLTILESDGSRALPLKGWRDDEPVLLPLTSCTVGVMTLWPLGKPVREEEVLHPELFVLQSGAEIGAVLTPAHCARLCGKMFERAPGRRVLFINRIEDGSGRQAALGFAAQLDKGALSLERIVCGSVHECRYETLWIQEPIIR